MRLEEVLTLKGDVWYDWQLDTGFLPLPGSEPSEPAWLQSLLGNDFFARPSLVDLQDTQVTDERLARLEGLTQLQELCLNKTQITDVGLAHIARLSRLENVWLQDTQVTDAGLEHLKRLDYLQYLCLSDSKVTDAGVNRLQQALPNCKIIH